MSDLDKEYEASLKSIETENKIDRIFYRPIGFRIARMLRGTGITPNMVTVVSIFVGAAVGFFFYHDDLIYNVCGILLLVFRKNKKTEIPLVPFLLLGYVGGMVI